MKTIECYHFQCLGLLLDLNICAVEDPEGVQGVRSNPPLELDYFIFVGNFRKNEAKLRK